MWGCYLSPVGDAYAKPGLAPAPHRLEMARRAAETSPLAMADGWEAARPGHTRTLELLRRFQRQVDRFTGWSGREQQQPADQQQQPADQQQAAKQQRRQQQADEQQPGGQQPGQQRVRVMLLCGADLLATMAVPGVWHQPDALLREFGAVCVARGGTDLERLLAAPPAAPAGAAAATGSGADASSSGGNCGGAGRSGSAAGLTDVLWRHRDRVIVVRDNAVASVAPSAAAAAASGGDGGGDDSGGGDADVSSTRARRTLAAGGDAAGLVAPAVLAYIRQHGLYGAAGAAAAVEAAGGGGGGQAGGGGGGSGG